MGGGQGKAANGSEYLDACDHTPIFRCFDGLDSAEQSQQFKEQVASFFHRQSIPAGASVFDHKVGRRDLVIVEKGGLTMVSCRAGQESEIPNFKGSYLGRFPLVSADFWTSDHLSERSRRVDVFLVTRARGTLTLKRR